MTVGVIGIGGAGGGGDTDEGDDAGSSVQQGVDGVGKNTEAPQVPTDPEFDQGQQHVDGQRREEHPADPAGAGGFAHGRRSAMPPARGAR